MSFQKKISTAKIQHKSIGQTATYGLRAMGNGTNNHASLKDKEHWKGTFSSFFNPQLSSSQTAATNCQFTLGTTVANGGGGSSKKCTQTVPLIYPSSFHSCLLLSRSSQRHGVHLIHRSHKRSRMLGHADASEVLRKTPPDLTEGLKFPYGKVQSQGLTHLS